MKPPAPAHKPTTMKALYSAATGDRATHQLTIAAIARKLTARRRRILRARLAGMSFHQIAAREGLTHGTIAKDVARSLEAIRKAAHHEPRYNKTGRARKRGQS